MHANAVETLLPFLEPGAKVLDIGQPRYPHYHKSPML